MPSTLPARLLVVLWCVLQDMSSHHPMVVVDCSSAAGVDAASQLLQGGLGGLARGDCSRSSVDVANDALLLSALTDGTLVLNNVHKVCGPAGGTWCVCACAWGVTLACNTAAARPALTPH